MLASDGNTPHCTDLYWQVQGYSIPADYRYWLYSGLVLVCPPLKTDTEWRWQLGGIDGAANGSSLILGEASRLHIRTPSDRVPELVAALAGQVVRIGSSLIQVGSVSAAPVSYRPNLTAWIVAIRLAGQTRSYLASEFEFGVTFGKQMLKHGLETKPRLKSRAGFRIKGDLVRGFGVGFQGLKPEESVWLQCNGLGGSRRIGAGVFVPAHASTTLDSGTLRTNAQQRRAGFGDLARAGSPRSRLTAPAG
ncbi:MAG: type I-MYXAN CRISPR-associated protein Cas6/Cmx6 [Spirulinaceae cyanobacterium SM2_1_0]|nr:type I-MYXAN CRISPR-associated protein Cas6/Cmx6 [Spirulinaceae cyanobacterium SM2_1_0]